MSFFGLTSELPEATEEKRGGLWEGAWLKDRVTSNTGQVKSGVN